MSYFESMPLTSEYASPLPTYDGEDITFNGKYEAGKNLYEIRSYIGERKTIKIGKYSPRYAKIEHLQVHKARHELNRFNVKQYANVGI